MAMNSMNKQDYTNVPLIESPLYSSDSITSRTPITCRDSPSPDLAIDDKPRENPYEMPIDFEDSRLRHEERMIAQRQPHRKKKSPLYELTRVDNVSSQRLSRGFSFDDSEMRSTQHGSKRSLRLFVVIFALILLALSIGAFNFHKIWTFQTESQSQICLQRSISEGNLIFIG